MKRTIILLISILSCAFSQALSAQTIPEGYELVDSVVYRPVSAVDTTLAGKDVFHILPSRKAGDDANVKVHQSDDIRSSMREHIATNAKRTVSGYRVRIFFDNKQTARTESENTLKKFNGLFPEVMAYRIYANPYFKVTVGDFRTKSEAMALLSRIKGDFPSAFVVKENIEYPVVDSDNAVVADTVKVLRPIAN
ncbi:MAG: SPOR domain-containing protein [Bacteroidales bacterium]|nr:SPOR domain-containing protein [Bacteroidales bacterium]